MNKRKTLATTALLEDTVDNYPAVEFHPFSFCWHHPTNQHLENLFLTFMNTFWILGSKNRTFFYPPHLLGQLYRNSSVDFPIAEFVANGFIKQAQFKWAQKQHELFSITPEKLRGHATCCMTQLSTSPTSIVQVAVFLFSIQQMICHIFILAAWGLSVYLLIYLSNKIYPLFAFKEMKLAPQVPCEDVCNILKHGTSSTTCGH